VGFWLQLLGPHGVFRTLPICFLLVLLSWLVPPQGFSGPLGDQSYLNELRDRAAALRLADEREWQVLLHYRRTLLGGVESMQDDPGVFLDLQRKTDHKTGLSAQLAPFHSRERWSR